MPELEIWTCGNCGAALGIEEVDRASARFCGHCGAALALPEPARSGCDVRIDRVGNSAADLMRLMMLEYRILVPLEEIRSGNPIMVASGLDQEVAETMRQRLLAIGAKVSVISAGGPAANIRLPQVADPMFLGSTMFEGTVVEVRRVGDDAVLASTTLADQQLLLSIPTGGSPLAAWLSIRRPPPDSLLTWIFFNHPLTQSHELSNPTMTMLGLAFPPARLAYEMIAQNAGCELQPGTGIVALRALTGELGDELADVSFGLTPALPLIYLGEGLRIEPGRSSTSSAGFAYAFNVPPGEIQVAATSGGGTWQPVVARVSPDAATEVDFWQ